MTRIADGGTTWVNDSGELKGGPSPTSPAD